MLWFWRMTLLKAKLLDPKLFPLSMKVSSILFLLEAACVLREVDCFLQLEKPQENLPFDNIRLPAHYNCSSGNLEAPILPVIQSVYNKVPDPRSWVANARSHVHPRSQVPSCRSILPARSQAPRARSQIGTLRSQVPGTRSWVPDDRLMIPSPRCQVLGSKCQLSSSRLELSSQNPGP